MGSTYLEEIRETGSRLSQLGEVDWKTLDLESIAAVFTPLQTTEE